MLQLTEDQPVHDNVEIMQWLTLYIAEMREHYTRDELVASELAIRAFLLRWSKAPGVDMTFVTENGTVYLAAPELDFYVALSIMLMGLSEVVRKALQAMHSSSLENVQ